MKWYKRDPQVAREGMRFLTLEERGAYNTIIDLIYETDNRLHDDDYFLVGHLRCDLRVWKRIKLALIKADRIYLQDGMIRDARADATFSQAAAVAEANADKGRKSGEARKKIKPLAEPRREPKPSDIDIPKGIDGGKPPLPPASVEQPAQLELEDPPPRGVAALKAAAVDRHARAGRWEEFRAAYPRREGSQSWPAAQKKYQAIVASGTAEADIIAGAKSYALHLQKTGQVGTRYVKQALTWLNQRGWDDEYLATGRSGQSDLMAAFDARLGEARARADDRFDDEGGGAGPGFEDDPAPPF